jgi:hypothetical protein
LLGAAEFIIVFSFYGSWQEQVFHDGSTVKVVIIFILLALPVASVLASWP